MIELKDPNAVTFEYRMWTAAFDPCYVRRNQWISSLTLADSDRSGTDCMLTAWVGNWDRHPRAYATPPLESMNDISSNETVSSPGMGTQAKLQQKWRSIESMVLSIGYARRLRCISVWCVCRPRWSASVLGDGTEALLRSKSTADSKGTQ